MKTMVKNFTTSPQQIHFADGSNIVVGIGGGVEIDKGKMFPEEFERIKNFFRIEVIEDEQIKTVKPVKKNYEVGGNE